MASSAIKDIKFGFWVALGFAFFAIAAGLIMGLSAKAFAKG